MASHPWGGGLVTILSLSVHPSCVCGATLSSGPAVVWLLNWLCGRAAEPWWARAWIGWRDGWRMGKGRGAAGSRPPREHSVCVAFAPGPSPQLRIALKLSLSFTPTQTHQAHAHARLFPHQKQKTKQKQKTLPFSHLTAHLLLRWPPPLWRRYFRARATAAAAWCW